MKTKYAAAAGRARRLVQAAIIAERKVAPARQTRF
jgi:hypothetical protein